SGARRRTAGAARAARPVTSALGEAKEAPGVMRRARAASRRRLAFVNLGFAGVPSGTRARWVAAAVVRHLAPPTRLVLVAYADWERVGSLSLRRLIAIAAAVGAAGVLLDTARKAAPLFALEAPEAVEAWVATVHAAGLFAALAGSLMDSDIATAGELGADVVGVRGAACIGGRLGRVSPERVATLVALTRAASGVPALAPPLPLPLALSLRPLD